VDCVDCWAVGSNSAVRRAHSGKKGLRYSWHG
jgi:hypothetical protein